jgi:hypothetical protein
VGGFALAFMFGEGMIFYRWIRKAQAPPPPGALALASIIFIALAALAEYQPARGAATAFAWGLDLAVLLQLIGKEPDPPAGWPPLCVPQGQILPSAGTGVTCTGTAASTSSSGTNPVTKVQQTEAAAAKAAGRPYPGQVSSRY